MHTCNSSSVIFLSQPTGVSSPPSRALKAAVAEKSKVLLGRKNVCLKHCITSLTLRSRLHLFTTVLTKFILVQALHTRKSRRKNLNEDILFCKAVSFLYNFDTNSSIQIHLFIIKRDVIRQRYCTVLFSEDLVNTICLNLLHNISTAIAKL